MMKPQTGAGMLLLFALFLITPSAATISLQNVQVAPPGDEIPAGDVVNATAIIQIIPQGPTTYIEGYTLVLSTDLDRALWNVVVLVDGAPAAVIPQNGNYVFINGFLLSYQTNHDISVSARVRGNVPVLADATPFRVIQAEELNNQGQIVSGTEQVVIRYVMNPGTGVTVPPSFGETTTVVIVPAPVTTTKAGLPLPLVLGVVVLAVFFLRKVR